jgi:hypothetical protein
MTTGMGTLMNVWPRIVIGRSAKKAKKISPQKFCNTKKAGFYIETLVRKRPNIFLNRKKAEPYIETLVKKRPRNFLNEKTLGTFVLRS